MAVLRDFNYFELKVMLSLSSLCGATQLFFINLFISGTTRNNLPITLQVKKTHLVVYVITVEI